MKRKIYLGALAVLGSAAFSNAQYYLPENRVWAVKNNIGLDFSAGDPVVIPTSLTGSGNEGHASVCDSAGRLLFYTDGAKVWDSTHTAMPSALTITGSVASVTQPAVIIPAPSDPYRYYLFLLNSVGDLYSGVVDMRLNGGNGDVDVNYALSGVKLDSGLTEKMTSVSGCGNNSWVLVLKKQSNDFHAFEITASGVVVSPVISSGGNQESYTQGVLKASPGRTKIMVCNFESFVPKTNGVEVFDFDYMTGRISNPLRLDSGLHQYYGGTFSPDNSKVYVQSTTNSKVYQFDLDHPDPAVTKTELGPSGQYTDMRIGADGKVYFGALPGSPGWASYKYFGRINSPDESGTDCDFQDSVTALEVVTGSGSGALMQGLPAEVFRPFYQPDTLFSKMLDTLVPCTYFEPFTLHAPEHSSDHLWSDGSRGRQLEVSIPGIYWLSCSGPCPRVDTFVVAPLDIEPWVIDVSYDTLIGPEGFETYQWYLGEDALPGETGRLLVVRENGTYALTVTRGRCSDIAFYEVRNVKVQDPGTAVTVRVFPNPSSGRVNIEASEEVCVLLTGTDGRIYRNRCGSKELDLQHLAEGVYILNVTDSKGNLLHRGKLVRTR